MTTFVILALGINGVLLWAFFSATSRTTAALERMDRTLGDTP